MRPAALTLRGWFSAQHCATFLLDAIPSRVDFSHLSRSPRSSTHFLLLRSCSAEWLELMLLLLRRCCFQYAQVVASENPDLIKCFVEKMPLPPHLEGNAIALQLVDYAQVQKKQWTVETGNQ